MILVTCSGNVGRATLAGAAQSWRPTLPTGGAGYQPAPRAALQPPASSLFSKRQLRPFPQARL
jgi:hypothetical protein